MKSVFVNIETEKWSKCFCIKSSNPNTKICFAFTLREKKWEDCVSILVVLEETLVQVHPMTFSPLSCLSYNTVKFCYQQFHLLQPCLKRRVDSAHGFFQSDQAE